MNYSNDTIPNAGGTSQPVWTPFPTNSLPAPMRNYAEEAAAAIGCDVAMLAVPMLPVVAAAIGASRRLFVKGHAEDAWEEPAILWSGIVAPSGSYKTPALKKACGPVKKIQSRLFTEWKAQTANAEKGQGKDIPPPPRVMASDVTIEALAVLLQANPRGLLYQTDEMSRWLGSMDLYKDRGAGAARGKWLEVTEGDELTVDRKGSPVPVHVKYPAVSITGGIQPRILPGMLTAEDAAAGLDARILFAAPPMMPTRWSDRIISPETSAEYRTTIERLFKLRLAGDDPRMLTLTPEAKRLLVRFFDENGVVLDEEHEESRRAFLSKNVRTALRIALVLRVVRSVADLPLADPDDPDPDESWRDVADPVEACDMAAGVEIAQWFVRERDRLKATIADPKAVERDRLAGLIRNRGGEVRPRELMRQNSKRFPTAAAAEAALRDLAEAGLGKIEVVRPGPTGGQPTTIFKLAAAAMPADHAAAENPF